MDAATPEPDPVDPIAVNRAQWDERAPAHAASPDYHFEDYLADPDRISEVVRFDLPRLGDVAGLRGVHLQCHLGTDTLSLARLGAQMTGLDFSAAALTQARALAAGCGAEVEFVESDVLQATTVLPAAGFDLVFTGIGALCWLPDIKQWARVVTDLLRPGGRLFLREGHPMLWSLADPADSGGALAVEYPYFAQAQPLRWTQAGTYVRTDAQFQHKVSYEWPHALGEIFTALLDCGLQITGFVEHDSIPWDGLPGLMEPDDLGEYRLAERPERLAASYTLQAVKVG